MAQNLLSSLMASHRIYVSHTYRPIATIGISAAVVKLSAADNFLL